MFGKSLLKVENGLLIRSSSLVSSRNFLLLSLTVSILLDYTTEKQKRVYFLTTFARIFIELLKSSLRSQ